MEEGLFTSIIDDIDIDAITEDQLANALPSNLTNNIISTYEDALNSKSLGKVVNGATVAYKYTTMSPDTPIGQLANRLTQYSDFAGRFALYEHEMKAPKAVRKTEADIIEKIDKTFIKYSVNQHKAIQYASDKGIFMYPIFLLRVQSRILELFQTNPASALAVAVTQKLTKDMPDITDSSLLTGFNLDMLQARMADYGDAFQANILKWIP